MSTKLVLTFIVFIITLGVVFAQKEQPLLKGCVLRRFSVQVDSGSVMVDTSMYDRTYVRLQNAISKEVVEVPTDQNGCYRFFTVEMGTYRLFIDDPVVGTKFIRLDITHDKRNLQVRPIIIDRESATLKVLPKNWQGSKAVLVKN